MTAFTPCDSTILSHLTLYKTLLSLSQTTGFRMSLLSPVCSEYTAGFTGLLV